MSIENQIESKGDWVKGDLIEIRSKISITVFVIYNKVFDSTNYNTNTMNTIQQKINPIE